MHDKLYLPISTATIEALINENIHNGESYQRLKVHEVAALLVVNQLPKMSGVSNPNLQKILAGIIEAGQKHVAESETLFIDEVKSKLDKIDIRKGLTIASTRAIYFLPDFHVEKGEFLSPEGLWRNDFALSYKHPDINEVHYVPLPSGEKRAMFSNQLRIFNQIEKSVSDEHVQVQGYAGSGKTYMLSTVAEILDSKKRNGRTVLVLARTTTQLRALDKKLPSGIKTMTYGQLVSHIIPTEIHNPNICRMKEIRRDYSAFPFAPIARELNLRMVQSFHPTTVARVLFQMVANFCDCRNEHISSKHIPKRIEKLSNDDVGYLVANANLLWELVVNPPDNFPFTIPIRDYHVVKYVALKGYRIPAYFSHIIADESHDLNGPMLDIIERSQQGFIGLGDEYQFIGGTPAKRKTPAVNRRISDSHRVPSRFEKVVNFSLEMHTLQRQDEFTGNRERNSELEFYTRPSIPDKPCAIWVDDEWELFEWVDRLVAKGLNYRLLGSIDALSDFVRGCIKLYQDNERTRVISLSRYRNWSSVMQAHPTHQAVDYINKRFTTGYKLENWVAAQKAHNSRSEYVIGLYQNSRNHEFDRVMLAPAVVSKLKVVKELINSNSPEAKAARADFSSRLYLGITRSREALILPSEFADFMHFL